ncbi:DUF1073 domain-containing protein [Methylobacterium sp. WL19]|uniref:DUF1073 domain-containing protein n=1 Tax=Methylobacterium sp. WL19 TaxID=2603896 RepID=UPI001650450D|nr:DUF1073 domain-containing protein [Methylobacterium sp. WL19]
MSVHQSRQKPREEGIDPYAAERLNGLFPSSVLGEGSGQIAQDGAIAEVSNWASAGYADYALSEGVAFLGYPYLAALSQRAEYRKIVEVIATEMTRKWIRITSQGDDDKSKRIRAIEEAFDRLNIRDAFRRAAEQDGFFGRAHIFISLKGDDQPNERAASIGDGRDETSRVKVPKGSLQRLVTVEPYWVAANPISFNSMDPLAPDFYRPNNWNVMGKQVHTSRLFTFVGRSVPDVLKPAYAFGGLAMTQMAKPYVDNWLKTRESVSDLIASFSVSGVKGMDIVDALANGQMEDLFNRIEVFNNLRDNRGFMALMANEEFFNVSTPLGTLDKLQAQAQEQMASVSGIPLVKLLGVTPSGLNASSDGEIRVFYDYIHAYQRLLFGPNLKRLLSIVQLSEFGDVDESIGFEFEPLWEMSDKEKADVRLVEAQTAQAYVDSSIILPEEERKRLSSDKDGTYQGLDLSLDIAPDPTELLSEPPEPDRNDEGREAAE